MDSVLFHFLMRLLVPGSYGLIQARNTYYTGPSSARRIKKIIKHYEYSPGTLTRARLLKKSYEKQSLIKQSLSKLNEKSLSLMKNQ